MLDVARIKQDFPIFQNNPNLVYLDSAATTQKPRQVINAVREFYENYCSNVHRGIYRLSERATEEFMGAREKVARFIGAEENEIVFTRNATESLNLLAYTLSRSLSPGDEILLTVMEHHSNIVPWQLVSGGRFRIRYVDIDGHGLLDMEDLKSKLNRRTKVVSVTHVSNVLGTINDLQEISKMAHENGSVFIVDGAQGVPHMPVDVSRIDCDFMAFSGHKMLGPNGSGVLYGKYEMLRSLPPFLGGGEMIQTVSTEQSTFLDPPLRFEAGTPDVEAAIGLGAAVDYLERIGMANVREHERGLMRYVLEREGDLGLASLVSYGPRDVERRGGVYTFNLGEIPPLDSGKEIALGKAIHPHDVASSLDRHNVAVRSGHHCAMPLIHRLGLVAASRASFYIYNDRSDVDALFEAIERAMEVYG
ncbi:cysteine desulfurase [Thermogymnomonas acidicola]|uniref:Cysteine desulfurase n=1 Tax=Thermogymnomonas acidicola TaxID=399579 RepID=A0AA37BPT9_9ARCH|nr:SufS family cysteine desulfurase [Thermogymnomonas acidicola]GGM66729.1 cysteine desulfurase [Thermogymnomonas acidicola]